MKDDATAAGNAGLPLAFRYDEKSRRFPAALNAVEVAFSGDFVRRHPEYMELVRPDFRGTIA